LFALLLEKQVKVSRLGFGLICANALLVAVAATA